VATIGQASHAKGTGCSSQKGTVAWKRSTPRPWTQSWYSAAAPPDAQHEVLVLGVEAEDVAELLLRVPPDPPGDDVLGGGEEAVVDP
jgi:hypothetical protein